ncbi:hypothetical protein HYPBUDRAFT_8052 [Hyphopichia burtonii NRRL Y-1933]|uniref:C2H2-type domain-containing protein n=1 Tax=Hyphopichia burtonii NRRL Y-1933 TaxID=984485 RepID=A0A1E4RD11_9ASCO|nr:hypothetical protein HYPBUDRAFT_8052 [Hyphopichia burtonii NRRL Y-1933]ODV65123.1 hypothetical protein HYPBUDRAFT_8052 [Hyphopichia burtonii NRRL Y-1933]
MGRSEAGSAKYASKQLKASGLQKLKFYCQLCSKQCRDANGFKNHLNSPSHKGRVQQLSESGEGHSVIENYSRDFEKDFLKLLRINHGTKKINANKFYQEYILHDKDHVHMNSTRWSSLTSFIKYLGNKGLVRVESPPDDTDEFNLDIRLTDTSSEYYQKQQQYLKKQRSLKTDEQISMKLLNEQIKQGQKYQDSVKEAEPAAKPAETLNGPIKLSLSSKRTLPRKTKAQSAFDGSDSDEEDLQEPPKKTSNIQSISNRLLSNKR